MTFYLGFLLYRLIFIGSLSLPHLVGEVLALTLQNIALLRVDVRQRPVDKNVATIFMDPFISKNR